MPSKKVLDQYENGCRAVKGNQTAYVRTEDGREIGIGSSARGFNTRRIRLLAALRVLYGDVKMTEDRSLIPREIAVAGKPAIASYLFAVHGDYYILESSRYRLAYILDIEKSTLSKYFRRILDEAREYRIGGEGL